MQAEQTINNLMKMGWRILDTAGDDAAARQWKARMLRCLTALMGPDHVYCAQLREFFRETGKKGLLAGTGILTAAKEQLAGAEPSLPGLFSTNRAGQKQEDSYED